MGASMDTLWIFVAAILLMAAFLVAIRRHKDKQQVRRIATIAIATHPEVLNWFIDWLAERRKSDPDSISGSSKITLDEMKDGLTDAILHFNTPLLRDVDIRNVREFTIMITKQLSHEGAKKKKAANS